ncbi:MAG: RNA methyltransferase [Rhodoferax sp.]|nr:RNA methyltransferase [Rhodoferax sp.]
MSAIPGLVPVVVHSRDNPLFKRLRRLLEQPAAYRKLGEFWIEGDHLCSAALARGATPAMAVFAESFYALAPARLRRAALVTTVLGDRLFEEISVLEAGTTLGFLMPLVAHAHPTAGVASVVLDRIQDAGNVGSILRSAAAFGFGQVLAIKGTAALWSTKVLRAAMGAHFGLQLVEGLDAVQLHTLAIPLVATSSHAGSLLHGIALPSPCAWVFGHEGQGVSEALSQQASLLVRIGQPGGEESLNVAAAAAICLPASAASLALAAAAG